MEQLYGEYGENFSAEIGHHLYQAGALADGARTARYLMIAGERARSASAFDEAIQMLDAAQTVLPPGDSITLGNLQYFRGMSLRGNGRMEEALVSFQNSIDILPRGKNQNRPILSRAQLLLDLYRGHDAVNDIELLLGSARETGNKTQEVASLQLLGWAYYIISLNEPGGGERALEAYEHAYKLAREMGDKAGMARARIPTNHLVDYWPDFRDRALSNIQEAVRLAEEIGDEDLIYDAAKARLRFLSPGESCEQAGILLERMKTRRDPIRLKELYFSLMWTYRRVGDFLRCVEICDASIHLAEELGANPVQYPTIKALALINLGRYDDAWGSLQQEFTEEQFGYTMQQYGVMYYLMDLLAFDRAAEKTSEVVELATQLDRAWMRTEAQMLRVGALTRLGTLDDEILEGIEQDLQSFGGELGRSTTAEVMFMKGSFGEALELVEASTARAEEIGFKLEWIPALELKLRILLSLDRFDEALKLADVALQQAEQTNYRPMQWRILAGRANAKAAMGDSVGAAEDYVAAARIIDDLAATIPDAELRRGFETNPLVKSIHEAINREKT
ncbi:MAG: hypothetical protein JRF25_08520 [Deltaproteobacteria bacterium]|nr:hypothetical protein [Deltaproteobacteria bacterium]